VTVSLTDTGTGRYAAASAVLCRTTSSNSGRTGQRRAGSPAQPPARRSVPSMIVAVVMVLRIEGCPDREVVNRFAFDARWKYAAGRLDFDYPGFVHAVLVDMRARLPRSALPDRILRVLSLGVLVRVITSRSWWRSATPSLGKDR
jgi:hypothetical protein